MGQIKLLHIIQKCLVKNPKQTDKFEMKKKWSLFKDTWKLIESFLNPKCKKLLVNLGWSMVPSIKSKDLLQCPLNPQPFCGLSLKKHCYTKLNTACTFWVMRIRMIQLAGILSPWVLTASGTLSALRNHTGTLSLTCFSFLCDKLITSVRGFYPWHFCFHCYSDTDVDTTLWVCMCEKSDLSDCIWALGT